MTAGNTQVTVTYTAPSNDGDSAITSYTVNAYTSLAPPILATSALLSTTTPSPIIVTGLTIGTPYYFSIYASNIIGAGIPSDISSTAVIPLGPPGPPRNITMTSIDYNSGTFSFLAPLNNGGSAVTNYTAEIYRYPYTSYTTVLTTINKTTVGNITFNVTQSATGYQYDVKMSAINIIGTSMPIYTSIQIKQITKPNAPSISFTNLTSYDTYNGDRLSQIQLTFGDNNGTVITKIKYGYANSDELLASVLDSSKYTYTDLLNSNTTFTSFNTIQLSHPGGYFRLNINYTSNIVMKLETSLGNVYSNVLKYNVTYFSSGTSYNLTVMT